MGKITIKRISRILVLVIMLMSLFTIISTTALAGVNDVKTSADKTNNDGTKTDVQKQVNDGVDGLINTIRGIAIGVGLIMLILIGISVGAGGAKAIAEHKVKAGIFLLALVIVFKTEAILGTVFKILNIDILKYL